MKKIFLVAIPIILILCLVGFRVIQKTGAETADKQISAARKNAAAVVQLTTAGPKSIANTIDAVASLESPFTVKLSPNVAGRIDYLEVREGDHVQKGDVLARIDPAQVEGVILQAQSNLAEAQQKLTQARITEEANTTTIYSTINQQKATVASTAADYNQVKVNYEATVGAAHEATVDAESKVRAAESNVKTSDANEKLAEANLEDSKAKYTRDYSLYTQSFLAPQDLDDAKAAEKVNEAQVNAAARTVDSAKSALLSAEAEYRAAAEQESIVKKQENSNLQDAKAKLTEADATLKTALANKSQIPAYTENLKALYSEVVAAKGALNQAIAQRAFLIVKSSIDGTVTQRLADPGAEASPGSQILILQYLQWLFVTSAIPVEYSQQVHPGLDVTMTLDELPGRVFHSKIVDINKSADPSSRQFMIRLKIQNPNNLFRPGMYARLNMVTSMTDAAVAVPREAVTTDANNNSTVVLVDSKMIAHVTPVTLGAQDSSNMQILSGLKAGDKVVVLTYRPIKDGAKVATGQVNLKKGAKGTATGGASGATSGPGSTPGAGTTGGGSATESDASTGSGAGGAAVTPPTSTNASPSTTSATTTGASPPAGASTGAAGSSTAASTAGSISTPASGGTGAAAGTTGVVGTGGGVSGGGAGGGK